MLEDFDPTTYNHHDFNGLPTSGPELTDEIKAKIDDATYYAMIEAWQKAPVGSFRIDSEVSKYFMNQMANKKARDLAGAVEASKSIMRRGMGE